MKAFEEWWAGVDDFWKDRQSKSDIEEAFLAGMLAAAEIAEGLINPAKHLYEDHHKDLGRLECAQAIRKAAQGGE